MHLIPGPWTAILLTLAAYRVTRLLGWDDWPPIAKARAWALGEHWLVPTYLHNPHVAPWLEGQGEPVEPEPPSYVRYAHAADVPLPGKTPESEAEGVRPGYDRPLLAHLIHCPFCLGAYVSLGIYLVWLWFPAEIMYAAVPAALSGAVGLIAKNLDP